MIRPWPCDLGRGSQAAELARRPRELGDSHGLRIAEGLEHRMIMGTALVGTDQEEARVTLRVIETWTPDRLRAVAENLREYLLTAAA